MQNPNPNFRFCNFCNNRDSRDPCRFTHWARNNETGEAICPFLKATVCMECMEYGHTHRMCPNRMRIFQLEMNASLPFLPPKKEYMDELEEAKDLFDAEHEHNRYAIALKEELIRRQHMSVAIKTQFCDYCAFHFPREQNTHVKVMCPRLSMCICSYCRENGHTLRFCPQKKKDELYNPADDEPEWELDFDCA